MSVRNSVRTAIGAVCGDTLMVRSLNRRLLPVLSEIAQELPPDARVLDIGAKHSPYASLFTGHCYATLDIMPENDPDIVGDICELSRYVAPESVDLIIATEVLEHVRDPWSAMSQIRTVLKPKGRFVGSVPFMVPYHPDPTDYWRFTPEGLKELTSEFDSAEVCPHGNRILSALYILNCAGAGQALRVFDGLSDWMFRENSLGLPLGYIVTATRH